MNYRPYFILPLLAVTTLSQASAIDACPASTSRIGNVESCLVEGSASKIQLNFESGFDDSTPTSPQGDNKGTTLGEQRKLSFIKAAEILTEQIASVPVIEVDAYFSPLDCDADSAVLGSAGAMTNFAYESSDTVPDGALLDTFYPIALLNALEGEDLTEDQAEIQALFNSNLGNANCLYRGGWYYGYGSTSAPSDYSNFTSVLLHEMTHGLGFASLVDPSTGEKPSSFNDIFSTFLYSVNHGRTWADPAMTNYQRYLSTISGNGLAWAGGHVNTQAINQLNAGFTDNDGDSLFSPGDCTLMYAPSPVESGSSISHFDTKVSPNELMEPNNTGDTDNLGLALYLLHDIGWSIQASESLFIKSDGCGAYPDSSTLTQRDSDALDLSIIGGSGDYDFELIHKNAGEDVTDLLIQQDGSLEFSYPQSGEFAGEYTLTITDSVSNEKITLDIVRPLRLIWSATDFMNDHTRQTLTVEGGEAGSTYTITQNPAQVLNFYVNGSTQDSTQAEDDADNFNPATFEIESNHQTERTQVDLTLSSGGKYAHVELNNSMAYPSTLYQLTITDSNNTPLPDAVISLSNYITYSRLNLETQYMTNQNGVVEFYLPDAGFSSKVSVSATGYFTEDVYLNTDITEKTVSLTVDSFQTTSQFGSGGSLPVWFLLVSGFLLLRPSRPLRH